MPNWCYTSYVFEGNKDEINDLLQKMQSLSERKESLVENDYGKTWLGNVIAIFSGNQEEIECRGHFFDLERFDETTLQFSTETAWGDMDEVWKFVCRHYTSVKYYFLAEECGNGYYATNDREGKHFSERFIVEQWEECTEYYDTEEQLFRDISERTATVVKNREEMQQAIEEYNTVNEENEIYVNEITIKE